MAPRDGQEQPRPDYTAQHRLPPFIQMNLNQPSLSWSLKRKRHQPPASRPSTAEPTAKCALVALHLVSGRPRCAASPTGAWRPCANACCSVRQVRLTPICLASRSG
ncbi:hypothetical protein V8C26DRAFT_411971 [Trichoderma gracile]